MKVYVVTGVELGWDCVVGVYTDEEVARKEYPDEDSYIIHEETLDKSTIDDYEDDSDEDDSGEDDSDEDDSDEFLDRHAREQFNQVISSKVNKVSVSNNKYSYNVDLLIELLESEGFKITYTGKTGYTMEKQK